MNYHDIFSDLLKKSTFRIVNRHSKGTSVPLVEYYIKDLREIPKNDTCKFARHFSDICRKGCSITKPTNVQFTRQDDRHSPSGSVFLIQRGYLYICLQKTVGSAVKELQVEWITYVIVEINKKIEIKR